MSELECSRHINWRGQWRRVDHVAAELQEQHPESFRPVTIQCRNGEKKQYWVFTKVVRLKKYGEKRLVIVHEQEERQDRPRCFLTDAKHWESTRILETWSYRWTAEIYQSDYVSREYLSQATACGNSLRIGFVTVSPLVSTATRRELWRPRMHEPDNVPPRLLCSPAATSRRLRPSRSPHSGYISPSSNASG